MNLLAPEILEYAKEHSSAVPAYLEALERETYLKTLKPGMISNHVQGRFLSFISKIVQAKLIVEIGTFTGYSALCLAEGLTTEGRLVSYEVNNELSVFHDKYFKMSKHGTQIEVIYEDARLHLKNYEQNSIDLAFIDANKRDYLEYQELVLPKLRTGGVLITDNTLWKGKVLDENDAKTKAINKYNKATQEDKRVDNVLIPLDDGYQMMIKL